MVCECGSGSEAERLNIDRIAITYVNVFAFANFEGDFRRGDDRVDSDQRKERRNGKRESE
jgi:hypothetical protein